MSLYRDAAGLYRSPLLDEFTWLEHAFGTAHTGLFDNTLTLKQTHSSNAVHCTEWWAEREGDALLTAEAGTRVAVKTADCVPILLADPEYQVVAAVHAGWRGTVQRIVAAAIAEMQSRYGSRAQNLRAALGPSIRPCCFEVGAEVAVEFKALFPERKDLEARTRIDLPEANRRILTGAGVPDASIATEAPCTVCGGPEFHSWRRDKQTGARMYSMIGIRGH